MSSALAGNGDLEGPADLQHSFVAEPAETLDECCERYALDRIEIDDRSEWDQVVRRLEEESRSVRVLLVHEIARHCLSRDVIRRVAEYHDEALAHFWQLKTAA